MSPTDLRSKLNKPKPLTNARKRNVTLPGNKVLTADKEKDDKPPSPETLPESVFTEHNKKGITEEELLTADEQSVASVTKDEEDALLQDDLQRYTKITENNGILDENELDYNEDPDNISLAGESDFDTDEEEEEEDVSNFKRIEKVEQNIQSTVKNPLVDAKLPSPQKKVSSWQEKNFDADIKKSHGFRAPLPPPRLTQQQQQPQQMQQKQFWKHQPNNQDNGKANHKRTSPTHHNGQKLCFSFYDTGKCPRKICHYKHIPKAPQKVSNNNFQLNGPIMPTPIINSMLQVNGFKPLLNILLPKSPPTAPLPLSLPTPIPPLLQDKDLTVIRSQQSLARPLHPQQQTKTETVPIDAEERVKFLNDLRNRSPERILQNVERYDIGRKWLVLDYIYDLHKAKSEVLSEQLKSNWRGAMEDTIIQIKNLPMISLWHGDITEKIFELKSSLQWLKFKDFLLTAEIQFKLRHYPRCSNRFLQMFCLFPEVDLKECCAVIEKCVDNKGHILIIWEHILPYILQQNNDFLLGKFLTAIDFSVLNSSLNSVHIKALYQMFCDADYEIKDSVKIIYLKLFTTRSTFEELVMLLSRWNKIKIPVVTLEWILQHVLKSSRENLVTALNIIKQLSSETLHLVADSLNELLLQLLVRRAHQCQEDILQIYNMMQHHNVKFTQDVILRLLNHFCNHECFEFFSQMYLELEELKPSIADISIPSWLCSSLLESLSRNNKQCSIDIVYKMVQLLMTSEIPPPDKKMSEIVNMLITRNSFRELYNLVKQCFTRGVVLSQFELRRIVDALEDWYTNIDASIEIYIEMRKRYPRPEHCGCYKKIQPPARIHRTQSNTVEYQSYRVVDTNNHAMLDTDDDNMTIAVHSPDNSIMADDDQMMIDTDTEHNDHDDYDDDGGGDDDDDGNENDDQHEVKDLKEEDKTNNNFYMTKHELLKISSEFSQCVPDSTKLCELYLQVVSKEGANNNTIVTGLYMAMTGFQQPSELFEKFIQTLKGLLEDENTDETIFPYDVTIALSRIAIRMIKYYHKREEYDTAFDILQLLHEYALPYNNGGEGFSTMIETSEDLRLCEMCNLCCDVCIHCNQLDSAYHVLKYFNFGLSTDSDLTEQEQQERNLCVSTLIQGLLQANNLNNTWEIYLKTYLTMLPEDRSKLANQICYTSSINSSTILSAVFEFLQKNNMQIHPLTMRSAVKAMYPVDVQKAAQMFMTGVSIGVYDDTFHKNKFIVHFPRSSSPFEIVLTLTYHFYYLSFDAEYRQLLRDCRDVIDQRKPFLLALKPVNNDDPSDDDVMMNKIEEVITKTLTPPLEIKDKRQVMKISNLSISSWLDVNFDYLAKTFSTTKKDTQEVPTAPRPQKKRKIHEPQLGYIQVTTCPTPQHQNPLRESESTEEEKIIIPTNNASQQLSKRQVIKSFPDTKNVEEAKKNIRRVICSQLTAVMKKVGGFNKEFSDVARSLFSAFLNHLHQDGSGVTEYNKYVCWKAEDFVKQNYHLYDK